MSQPSFGVFFNDEWKVSPRVTVSGGLRYDIHWPVSEASNLESKFIPSLGKLVRVGNGIDSLYSKSHNFGPRAGLAALLHCTEGERAGSAPRPRGLSASTPERSRLARYARYIAHFSPNVARPSGDAPPAGRS